MVKLVGSSIPSAPGLTLWSDLRETTWLTFKGIEFGKKISFQ